MLVSLIKYTTSRCINSYRKTSGENLENLKVNGYYEKCNEYLAKVGLKREDIIRKHTNPIGSNGAIAILEGNLALKGAVIKHSAVPKEMHKAISSDEKLSASIALLTDGRFL